MSERDIADRQIARLPFAPQRQADAAASRARTGAGPRDRGGCSFGDVAWLATHAAGVGCAAGERSSLHRSLLKLQRQYGNRCIGRLLRQADSGEADHEGGMDAVERSIDQARGGGQAMDEGTRTHMESAFGADFSGVRIHADARADGLSRTLEARAFATGRDVFFRQGEYSPGTSAGRELLAHELTHVVQQHGDGVQPKMTVSEPGDPQEVEADEMARAVMAWERQPQLAEDGKRAVHRRADTGPAAHLGAAIRRQCACGAQAASGDRCEACAQRDDIARARGCDTLAAHAPTPRRLLARQRQSEAQAPAVTRQVDGEAAPAAGPAGGMPAAAAPLPPRLRFWFQAFIPDTLPGARIQPTGPFAGRQVFKGPPLPFHWNSCFETDERGFSSTWGASSRIAFMIDFDTATGVATVAPRSDLTFEVDCTSGAVKCSRMPTPSVGVHVIRPLLPGSQRYDVVFSGSGNDPCVFGSPDIAIRGNLIIDLGARTVAYRPLITLFPAIEMYADLGGGTLTGFTHAPSANTVLALFVPGVLPVPGTFAF